MSDSINVRVTLDSYDIVHPAQKQTQVYVQIPEVARASWLLDASFYAVLKDEPWPHVIDSAHEEYERRGVVSDSTSAAARKAIVDWLLLSEGADYDARYDAVQAAWEADQARQHPVARKLLAENERLRARVAELESGYVAPSPSCTRCYGADAARFVAQGGATAPCPVCGPSEVESLRDRITELEAERHVTNEALDDAVQALREREQRDAVIAEFVAARAGYITAIRNCHPDNGHDYDRWQGHAAARRQLAELLGLPVAWPSEDAASVAKSADKLTRTLAPTQSLRDEDPNHLRHTYRLGRDLPPIGGATC